MGSIQIETLCKVLIRFIFLVFRSREEAKVEWDGALEDGEE